MVLTETGLAKVFQRIKSFIASQLNSKASAIHTHTASDITDLPNGYVVDSALSSSSENPVQNKVVKNALDGYVPRSGGAVMTGDALSRAINNDELRLDGGTGWSNGASIVLCGKDRSTAGGSVILHAQDANRYCQMILKPDGTLTWGNKDIDTIEEQGDGYIRYSNGLQICWGSISWRSNCTQQWETLYETSSVQESYAKSFVDVPSVSASGDIGSHSSMIDSDSASNTRTPQFWLCRATAFNDVVNCNLRYIAIGKWK